MATETLKFRDFRPSVDVLRSTYDEFVARLRTEASGFHARLPDFYGPEVMRDLLTDYDPRAYDDVLPSAVVEIEVGQVIRTYDDADEAFGRLRADSWTAVTLRSSYKELMFGFGEEWGEARKALEVRIDGKEGLQKVEWPSQSGVTAVMGPMSEAFKHHRLVIEGRATAWGRFWTTTNKVLKHPALLAVLSAGVAFIFGRLT